MSLNEMWQSLFGEDITPFEENLIRQSLKVLAPEEPLFLLLTMMVRILHGTLGDAEKALLRFAPQITDNAQSMIRSAVSLEQQLRNLEAGVVTIESLLGALRANMRVSAGPVRSSPYVNGWMRANMGPLLTSAAVAIFLAGYLLAAAIFHRA